LGRREEKNFENKLFILMMLKMEVDCCSNYFTCIKGDLEIWEGQGSEPRQAVVLWRQVIRWILLLLLMMMMMMTMIIIINLIT
jgi:hypothetical protein